MKTLNLGIVAHVDAGKTSLTERLLHAAGVIDTLGRVDDGSTQTDTLELERQRGITIKSAVVSFRTGAAVEIGKTPSNPFLATIGLLTSRAGPAPGSSSRAPVISGAGQRPRRLAAAARAVI